MKKRQLRYQPFSARRQSRKSKNKFIITLILSVVLLYASVTWILPTLIGGLSFVNKFKPTPTKETPISENATLAPPVLNIPYEATNSASIRIKGYTLPGASVEIYLDDELKTTTKASGDGSFMTDLVELNIGTNNISGKTIDEKNNKSLLSKPIKIIYDNEKPKLELTSPQDNQTLSGDKKVTVLGSTDPDNDISITINGTRAIVNSEGNFSQTIDINDGENNIVVISLDPAGNTTQTSRKVIYSPSQP